MARSKQTKGECTYCGRTLTRSGMARHLPTCDRRSQATEAATSKAKRGTFIHLQVQDAWGGAYWLQLEMDASATLDRLDSYLRTIWLECCGHLSQFSIGGWRGKEIPMRAKAGQVLRPGVELTHIYDFGTSSETLIKVVGERSGAATTPHPIALMARNAPPEISCSKCERQAAWLCTECIYEHEQEGTLCEAHAKNHPHEDYGGPVPLVNSPRVGLCGYDGPAEPPY